MYISFIESMLTGRRTRLKFDDYTSDWFSLDNGIVQGDPLSMILYLYYNADLLDIASGKQDMCLGYVDDMALVVVGSSFEETHQMLKDMMMRPGGAYEWSDSHNSKFKTSKSVLVNFSRKQGISQPMLDLQGSLIAPQPSHKFIGVWIDQELRWQCQFDYALAKATKWVLAFRRFARPASGASPQVL